MGSPAGPASSLGQLTLPCPSTGQAPRTTFHASLPYRPLHRRPAAPAVGHTQVQTLGPALKVLAHPTAVPEARPLLQGPSRSSVTVNRVPGMLRPPWAPSGPLTSRLLGLCSVALSPPRRPGRTPPGPSPHRVSSFPAGQAFCPPEGTLGSRVSQCRGLAWGAERGETADGPCGVCSCQHPQLSCRAQEVRPGDGLGRPGCGQPRATGRAGRKGKWTGGEGPRSCLPSARVGGGGGTLRGHSGTL